MLAAFLPSCSMCSPNLYTLVGLAEFFHPFMMSSWVVTSGPIPVLQISRPAGGACHTHVPREELDSSKDLWLP